MSASVIRFPRTRKRGRKVTTGPAAEITPFPLLRGDALDARLAWAILGGTKWDVEELPTEEEIAVFEAAAPCFRIQHGGNEVEMRARLADLENAVTKRKAIKEWLRARGCEARTPDEAVFALFNMVQAARHG
jgi:hypothetical protein